MNGSECFSIILVVLGVLLLLHHGYHHSFDRADSRAKEESCVEVCYFQVPDIANHETWVLICFTNAFSLLVLGPWLVTLNLS